MNFKTIGQSVGFFRSERLVQRTRRVSVQVVHHEDDLLGGRIVFLQEVTQSPALCANMSETTLSFSKLRARRIYMTEHAGRKPGENPEVTEKASRRRFTSEYKRRISLEAERCTQPGEIGALLRREGLYSSVVQRWRRQLREESLSSSKKSNGTPSPAQPSAAKEIASLKSENERLKERLRQAELIIDVQKKVSEMMQTRSPEKTD